MDKWIKYATVIACGTVAGAVYLFPAETFLSFVAMWIFLIPAALVLFLAFGLRGYIRDNKNRIMVSIKPTHAMRKLALREAELKREKEELYRELQNGIKHG